MAVTVSGTGHGERGERQGRVGDMVHYAVSDRVMLTGPLSVDVAVLDDAPVAYASTGARAASSPFALVVGGGLLGLGYASSEGVFYLPSLSVGVRKRLGPNVRLSAGAAGYAWLGARRHPSAYSGFVGVVLQVSQTVALNLDLHDQWTFRTITPSSRWTEHWFGSAPGLSYRPWHWFTLELDVDVAFLRRPKSMTPLPPDALLPRDRVDPDRPQVWGILGTHFHW